MGITLTCGTTALTRDCHIGNGGHLLRYSLLLREAAGEAAAVHEK